MWQFARCKEQHRTKEKDIFYIALQIFIWLFNNVNSNYKHNNKRAKYMKLVSVFHCVWRICSPVSANIYNLQEKSNKKSISANNSHKALLLSYRWYPTDKYFFLIIQFPRAALRSDYAGLLLLFVRAPSFLRKRSKKLWISIFRYALWPLPFEKALHIREHYYYQKKVSQPKLRHFFI